MDVEDGEQAQPVKLDRDALPFLLGVADQEFRRRRDHRLELRLGLFVVEHLLARIAAQDFEMGRERLSSAHHSFFAFSPVKFCHRSITTSASAGLISSAGQDRSFISAAMMVVPDPTNGSYTAWPGELLFSIGRFMHSTGFCVP